MNKMKVHMFFHEAYVLVGVMIHSLNIKISSSSKFWGGGGGRHTKVIRRGSIFGLVRDFSKVIFGQKPS